MVRGQLPSSVFVPFERCHVGKKLLRDLSLGLPSWRLVRRPQHSVFANLTIDTIRPCVDPTAQIAHLLEGLLPQKLNRL